MFAANHKSVTALVVLASILVLFQNCSPSTKFNSVSKSSKTSAPEMSGGEGYGGKLYELVSASDLCADPKLPPSEIRVQDATLSYLTAKNCQTLATPQLISVLFSPSEPTVLSYNAQIYRDVDSDAEFEPTTNVMRVVEAEDMARLPTSGGGVSNGILTINDNDYASTPVQFDTEGKYYFTVRASGDVVQGIGSIVELQIDGVTVGSAETSQSLFADYTFETYLPAGAYEVALVFTNDYHDDATKADRNLDLDRLTISKL